MLRKIVMSLAFVAGMSLVAGCDVPKSAAEKAKEAEEKAKQEAKAKLEESIVKPITDGIPKIEEKIKGLTGDTQKEATDKLAELKKSLDEFKSLDAAKMAEAKDKLLKEFEDLKKLVGLT
jgi:predicted butyrate kinase (DUF1464 family)